MAKSKRIKPSAEEAKAKRENVLLAALAYYADRLSQREWLAGGAKHRIAVTVAGEVDDEWVELDLEGELLVNHNQTVASSVAPDTVRLVALLLEAIPNPERYGATTEIAEHLAVTGELPALANEESKAIAEAFLARLRQKRSVERRGSVRFEAKPLNADAV